MRKVFLEDLPRRSGIENKVDWKKSVGYRIKFIYNDIKGEVEIVGYDKNTKKIQIKYNRIEYKILTDNFKNGKLGRILGVYTGEFKFKIGEEFKDSRRDMIIIDKKYIKNSQGTNFKHYKYKCNKCGYDEGWIYESNLLKGIGCACCCNPPQIVIENINSIVKTDPWMIPYFRGGYDEAKLYTRYSNQRIIVKCPDCGREKEIVIGKIYTRKSISCACGDGKSYPEKFMFNMLEQLGINFETQFSPDWIKPIRYDFYFELDNNKYIIETDGGLGHGKKTHSKSTKTIEETKAEDDYKDSMAKEHGIEVIRIDADISELEYIKNNILDSKLSDLFDLSNIDWFKCEEFALKNRVKEACELKRNNPNITSKEIGKIMNISNTTVINYMKKGTKLGWCNYDPKEESFKNGSKVGKSKGKQVEIFKDNISLGIFESATEIERQSEELFGIKLFQANISAVCRKTKLNYKMFEFKYI